jgi:putative transposase
MDTAKCKYPYLLRNAEINRSNQTWGIYIAYIPMRKGFMYLVAMIDLHSRYIVGRSLCNSMDAE